MYHPGRIIPFPTRLETSIGYYSTVCCLCYHSGENAWVLVLL